MAVYCPNCGTQINPGGRFCQACGTPTPQPSGPTPGQPGASAYYQAPPGAPTPKSGGALKIMLIVLGVVVVFGAVAIIGGIYFAKRALEQVQIKTGAGGQGEVSINTPGGKLNIAAKGTLSEEQLGLPIYPGAKAAENGGTVTFSSNDGKSGFIGGATFTTADSVEKVTEFYKDKLSDKAKVVETTSKSGQAVMFQVVTDKAMKTVSISNDRDGQTKIVIASIAKKFNE